MDAELTALAAAGATALVQQMVTDGWGNVRDRVVAFFSRGRDEEIVEGELEESRAELVAAQDAEDEEAAADVQASWRSRLRRTLRDDPEAAAELRALLDELAPPSAALAPGTVHNTISGGVVNGPVIQAYTVTRSGDVTSGESGRGA
ncbi:hypothetical protein FE633_30705 [Streptomyces montanus]|uniref:Uncharacterized protein n=1 Tax=Streptomyces montanus TaxID=2580423 RepID=A0A5R9FNW3_9ACTN|nr:hypothetical protein [Streptomyces montanus]TLS42513.1 hypothetical protein FE633_30705 [Streptomyces montanus]